ncbi:MAG: NfeD family protein [Clostridia bacterium]|nr:NfeD family protein [Clostridia bacterium]
MLEFFAEYGFALFWIAVVATAAIVEAETCELVAIWFVPGALISMIMAFFGVDFWIQAVVFIAISAAVLTLFFTVFKKHMPQKKKHQTNSDALIDAKGIVEEEINNIHEAGSVKVRGLVWTARSASDDIIIPAGTVVRVVEISGVKLICEPQKDD